MYHRRINKRTRNLDTLKRLEHNGWKVLVIEAYRKRQKLQDGFLLHYYGNNSNGDNGDTFLTEQVLFSIQVIFICCRT